MSFRWGIIGTGGIARAFANDLKRLNGHEVSAVGSRSLGKAEKFAAEFGGAPFGSYENLVEAEVDAIYVATPHSEHAANSILAMEAVKPVLCEKPFAVNAEQARLMIDAARQNQVALMEAMWSRFLPTYEKVRELLSEGALGEVISIYADHGQSLPEHSHYRLHAPELAGGALLDLGIYPISLASMILGTPAAIAAKANLNHRGVDAQTSMIFAYENGAQGVFTTTLEVQTPCTATIIGTKGRIELDSRFYAPTSMRLFQDGKIQEFPNKYIGHGLREQAIEFAEVVRSGEYESSKMLLSESLSIMETMDEIREQIGLRYPFE